MIRPQAFRDLVHAMAVERGAARRREVGGTVIADVRLGRLQASPIGRRFRTTGVDRDQVAADAGRAGLREQLLDHPFRGFVLALAESVVAKMAVDVDEVEGRPIVVVESPPDREVVVDHDRVLDHRVVRRAPNVVDVVLERELGECTPMVTSPWSLYFSDHAA